MCFALIGPLDVLGGDGGDGDDDDELPYVDHGPSYQRGAVIKMQCTMATTLRWRMDFARTNFRSR